MKEVAVQHLVGKRVKMRRRQEAVKLKRHRTRKPTQRKDKKEISSVPHVVRLRNREKSMRPITCRTATGALTA